MREVRVEHHSVRWNDGVAEEYDVPLLTEIPMDPAIRSSNETDGPPVVLRGGSAAEPFVDLRTAVTDRVGAVNRARAAGLDPMASAPSETS